MMDYEEQGTQDFVARGRDGTLVLSDVDVAMDYGEQTDSECPKTSNQEQQLELEQQQPSSRRPRHVSIGGSMTSTVTVASDSASASLQPDGGSTAHEIMLGDARHPSSLTTSAEPSRGVKKTSSLRRGGAGYNQLLQSAVMASIETRKATNTDNSVVGNGYSATNTNDDMDECAGTNRDSHLLPQDSSQGPSLGLGVIRQRSDEFLNMQPSGQQPLDAAFCEAPPRLQRKRSRHQENDGSFVESMSCVDSQLGVRNFESNHDRDRIASSSLSTMAPRTTTTTLMPRKVSCTGRSPHHNDDWVQYC